MRTLDIGKLRQEREQLTKRIEQLDRLLAAVDAFDGTAPKKAAGRPKGRGHMSPEGRRRIQLAQKARWAKFKAAQKSKG
jgi:hypothetical protein